MCHTANDGTCGEAHGCCSGMLLVARLIRGGSLEEQSQVGGWKLATQQQHTHTQAKAKRRAGFGGGAQNEIESPQKRLLNRYFKFCFVYSEFPNYIIFFPFLFYFLIEI